MAFRLYNSLTKRVEEFRPADPTRITFYSCGPTVYDFAHIGNFRSFLAADVLRRWLESPLCEIETGKTDAAGKAETHRGPRQVIHVMNITDVGHMTEDDNADGGGVDRMEEGGRRVLELKKAGKLPPGAPANLDPSDPRQIAEFYAQAFLEDARLLGLKVVADEDARLARGGKREDSGCLMPRPTDKIAQMQAMIRELLSKGLAYMVGAPGAAGTAVYFDVRAYDRNGGNYGALSGNTLDRLRAGAGGRVSAANQAGKRDPADFLLWKVDPSHRMKWEFAGTPDIGAGYPGWHIECSAMSRESLGQTIDLHSGGEDNIFPHHECEIAQSCGASGEPTFARHWLHVRHLMVEGAKMSKSRVNFYTIRDLVEKGFEPAAIRLELIKTHYRSNANFTEQGLIDSQRRVKKWRDALSRRHELLGASQPNQSQLDDISSMFLFRHSLHQDLGIAGALAAMDNDASILWSSTNMSSIASALFQIESLQKMFNILGLNDCKTVGTPVDPASDAQTEQFKRSIDAARAAKNYAESDRLRAEAEAAGYEVRMSKDGATVTKRAGL